MNIILTCIDNFQDYILDNIDQLLKLKHKNIYVITNPNLFKHFTHIQDKIKLVNIDNLNESYNFKSKSSLNKSFRNGFWYLTSYRLFYIYECMKFYNINDVIHLENDVLIYYNCDELLSIVNKEFVYLPFDTYNRNIISIMYIPTAGIYKKILDNYNVNKNDMENFAIINRKTNLIKKFPIYITSKELTDEEKFVSENSDIFPFIFDGAAIGQYLYGIDPRNNPNNTIGFINETCIIKYNKYKITFKNINGINKPFIAINNKDIPIFNLHIHSKKLKYVKNKKCIAVLTRGYKDLNSYNKLIKRNTHINSNLFDKKIDILIFHEGNITEEHKIYIKNKTPELNIIFIDILDIAFYPEKQNINVEEASQFKLGYRHMCSFWFINFFNAVKDYDKLLRIDEDCYIDCNIDSIFVKLDKNLFVTGRKDGDAEFVTKGLNNFSLDFIKRNNNNYKFKNSVAKRPSGPYTNLFGISLDNITNKKIFNQYKNEIDNSNMIYKRRWGDLPLWGEAIYYIFGDDNLFIDKDIKYFHQSHGLQVN